MFDGCHLSSVAFISFFFFNSKYRDEIRHESWVRELGDPDPMTDCQQIDETAGRYVTRSRP